MYNFTMYNWRQKSIQSVNRRQCQPDTLKDIHKEQSRIYFQFELLDFAWASTTLCPVMYCDSFHPCYDEYSPHTHWDVLYSSLLSPNELLGLCLNYDYCSGLERKQPSKSVYAWLILCFIKVYLMFVNKTYTHGLGKSSQMSIDVFRAKSKSHIPHLFLYMEM